MSKEKNANRGRGPEPVSVLMGLTVAWNMYGFATGFFERAWRGAPVPVTPISYALNAAIAIITLLVGGGRRWSTLVAAVLGGLMAAWSAIGVFFMSDREIKMAAGVPAVAAVLGALIAVFGLRARPKNNPRRGLPATRILGADCCAAPTAGGLRRAVEEERLAEKATCSCAI